MKKPAAKPRQQLSGLNVVALGGGTGLSTILRGLKELVARRRDEPGSSSHPIASLTAIVTAHRLAGQVFDARDNALHFALRRLANELGTAPTKARAELMTADLLAMLPKGDQSWFLLHVSPRLALAGYWSRVAHSVEKEALG